MITPADLVNSLRFISMRKGQLKEQELNNIFWKNPELCLKTRYIENNENNNNNFSFEAFNKKFCNMRV